MTKDEAIRCLESTRLMLLGPDNQPISDLYYALSEGIEALRTGLDDDPGERDATATSSAEIIRDFLTTIRDTARRWHGDNKTVTSSFCANCPIAGTIFPCDVILRLHDEDIDYLVEIYTAEKAKKVNR